MTSDLFFTADLHFFHEKVLEYERRPYKCLEDMHESLIQNWNSRVRNQDRVYVLGDFAFSWGKTSTTDVDSLLSRLKGQKFLIKGNHDRDPVTKNKRWAGVYDKLTLKVKNEDGSTQKILLDHCAHRVWPGMQHGVWMLYGHSHGNLPDIGGKTFDVGVDANAMQLWSYREIADRMEGRPIVTYDHHVVDSSDV